MENENGKFGNSTVFSKALRAGRRRTYFFDVRSTKGNDYYITITESKKKHNDEGYERHKIFLYKEDFNKFIEALGETVNHVKSDLLPEYDFDEFSKDNYDENHNYNRSDTTETPSTSQSSSFSSEINKTTSEEDDDNNLIL